MKKIFVLGAMILASLASRNATANAGSECSVMNSAGVTTGALLAGPVIFNTTGGNAQISCPLPLHPVIMSGTKIYYNMVDIWTNNPSAYCDLCVTTETGGVSCVQLTNVASFPAKGLYEYYMATNTSVYTYGGAAVRCWVANGQGVWAYSYPSV